MEIAIKNSSVLSLRAIIKNKIAVQHLIAINHPHRINILNTILSNDNNITFKDIRLNVNMNERTFSHHLSILYSCGYVKKYRIGNKTTYSVNQEKVSEVSQLASKICKNNSK